MNNNQLDLLTLAPTVASLCTTLAVIVCQMLSRAQVNRLCEKIDRQTDSCSDRKSWNNENQKLFALFRKRMESRD